MRRFICLMLIIALIPIPGYAFDLGDGRPTERIGWPEFKAKIVRTDKFLKAEDGKTLIIVGFVVGVYLKYKIESKILKGPKKYKVNNQLRIKPYNKK